MSTIQKIKKFNESYFKYYILLVSAIWLGMFLFCSWDFMLGGVNLYFFVMQKLFPIFGGIAIVMALISKKISWFIFGLAACFAFWINMVIIFGILPRILGN